MSTELTMRIKSANKALYRTAVPLCSTAAGELHRLTSLFLSFHHHRILIPFD